MASLNPQTLINEDLSYFGNGQSTGGELSNPSFMKSATATENLSLESDFVMAYDNGVTQNTITQSATGVKLEKGTTKLTVGDDVKVNGVLKVENTAGTQGLTITSGTINTVISALDGLPTITLQNVDNSVAINNDLRIAGSISMGSSVDATTVTSDFLAFNGASGQIGGILQNGTNIYVGAGTNLVGTGMKFDAQGNATLPGDITTTRSSPNHGGNLIAVANDITTTLTSKGTSLAPTGNGFLLSSINNVTPATETLNTVQMSGINGSATSEITTVNGRFDLQCTNKTLQAQATNGNLNIKTVTTGDVVVTSADEIYLQSTNQTNVTSSAFLVNTTGNAVLDGNQVLLDSSVLTNITSLSTIQAQAPIINITSADLNLSAGAGTVDISGATTNVTGNINLNAGAGTLQLTAPTTNVTGNLAVTGTITGTTTVTNPLNVNNSPNQLRLFCDSGSASTIRVIGASQLEQLFIATGNNAYVSSASSSGTLGDILVLAGNNQINFQTPNLTQNGEPLLGGVVNTVLYQGAANLSNTQNWFFNCRDPSASTGLQPIPVGNTPIPGGLYFVESVSFSPGNFVRSCGGILSFSGGVGGSCAGFFFNASPRSDQNDWQYLSGTQDGRFGFNFNTGGGPVFFAVKITKAV
jgi:hypothetical protein